MKNTAKIIIFIIIAIGVIIGGIMYNRRIDDATQKQTLADQQAANEQAAQAAQQEAQMDAQFQKTGIKDVVLGTGAEAANGSLVTVNYLGTLADGTKFDSSYDRKQPFQFTLGANQVIKGWDLGVLGMKVGGKRNLVIPPELGYGAAGAGNGLIPPNATLKFSVELLAVSSTVQ